MLKSLFQHFQFIALLILGTDYFLGNGKGKLEILQILQITKVIIIYFTEIYNPGTFPDMQNSNTSLYHIHSCAGGWTPFPTHKYPWHPNSGRCYRYQTLPEYYHKIVKRSTHHHPPTHPIQWTDARAICRAQYNGDLASIQDWRTNDFVARLTPGFAWIGANRASGPWQWSDGSTWLYTKWAPGHPVNINDNKYVAMSDGGEFGIWRAYRNNGKPIGIGSPGFVCQYNGGGGGIGTYHLSKHNKDC